MESVFIFGQNIKKARERKNITIIELAQKAGYNRFDLSTLESGGHDLSLKTAIDIAKALDRDFPLLLSRNFKVNGEDHFIENDYLSLFVENVRFILKAKNKFQYSISSLTGIEPENINRVLKKRVVPKVGTLERIAGAFETELIELFIRKGGQTR